LRHLGQSRSGQLHLLVFQQSAHQFGAWVLGFLPFSDLFGRQQHARLDLDEHGGHQEIFGSQFQVAAADFVHVAEVLAGDPRHRNVEDVEVLLADEIQQQIQRTFESLQEHLERIRRDVQILGQRKQGLAIQTRHGHVVHHLGHEGQLGGVITLRQRGGGRLGQGGLEILRGSRGVGQAHACVM
jgi:hypothetical protein